MALPDLLSVFDFQLKNGVTVSPLAGYRHAVRYRTIIVKDRHFISAFRAFYPVYDFLFFLIHYTSPSNGLLFMRASSRAF